MCDVHRWELLPLGRIGAHALPHRHVQHLVNCSYRVVVHGVLNNGVLPRAGEPNFNGKPVHGGLLLLLVDGVIDSSRVPARLLLRWRSGGGHDEPVRAGVFLVGRPFLYVFLHPLQRGRVLPQQRHERGLCVPRRHLQRGDWCIFRQQLRRVHLGKLLPAGLQRRCAVRRCHVQLRGLLYGLHHRHHFDGVGRCVRPPCRGHDPRRLGRGSGYKHHRGGHVHRAHVHNDRECIANSVKHLHDGGRKRVLTVHGGLLL